MADCKILFCDLDATLLDDQKNIEKGTRAAIDEMLAQGHIFAICTGRPLASAKKVADRYGLNGKGCYVVAYNGGVIYQPDNDTIISYTSIPLPVVHQMFDRAEEAGLYIHTYDRTDTVVTLRHTPEVDAYLGHTKLTAKTGADAVAGLLDEPAKMIVISMDDNQALKAFQEHNAAWAKDKLNSFFSCEQYLEYCPAGISKGAGVVNLCRHLGIPVELSVSAGDERNDVSMIKAAGLGAVPANAHREAAACSDYICSLDNNQGAVGEIIRKFILSK
ncbi:MAG: Cof-type HAD-IIB family hydrolase [Eubacterium sp.]|nr:Cof-type HAD-IIB family hydrolase [Eubacterium sp.]MCI8917642.1 Cof-type HAD-IIB family hydrolase [Eubacterium sp.]